MKKRNVRVLIGFAVVAGLVMVLFLTYKTYGNWAFALKLRGKKLVAFTLVGIMTSFATISFQTVTENHFLTPNILGLDSLYVLIQTLSFFVFGGAQMLSQQSIWQFLGTILVVTLLSTALAFSLLKRRNLFLLLMVGMILGTFFSSISTFLQVLMDPNEYDLLQGKLFASFGNVNSQFLGVAAILGFLLILLLWRWASKLDVLHLGRDQAMNLGIEVEAFQLVLLVVISMLVAIATALVGPVTFLGFIVANVSYQLFATYEHRLLFIGGALLALLFLVGGQFLVEQVFSLNTTLSVVIEFVGGIYFVTKIIKERGKQP
ncbi:iron chelate uptake ABC transporter family permease subunit [Enterococcus asini]|uniref:iron chelate uptake ABC transporter family permease subunit n=1 Tax=Enterococcus asini TaxID=57732 RepID=UPI002891B1FA|nr:iron chelate uptake ABC transporter family permease subunit [Enterococcus asini]MDT2757734.1 iron chelate uptake ABC transporter family permease subunit [Enterococcus asini]